MKPRKVARAQSPPLGLRSLPCFSSPHLSHLPSHSACGTALCRDVYMPSTFGSRELLQDLLCTPRCDEPDPLPDSIVKDEKGTWAARLHCGGPGQWVMGWKSGGTSIVGLGTQKN